MDLESVEKEYEKEEQEKKKQFAQQKSSSLNKQGSDDNDEGYDDFKLSFVKSKKFRIELLSILAVIFLSMILRLGATQAFSSSLKAIVYFGVFLVLLLLYSLGIYLIIELLGYDDEYTRNTFYRAVISSLFFLMSLSLFYFVVEVDVIIMLFIHATAIFLYYVLVNLFYAITSIKAWLLAALIYLLTYGLFLVSDKYVVAFVGFLW